MSDEMKFICDFMLGSLSRYLRMCNFDTVFIKNIKDDDLIKIAQETDRIILTKDKILSGRRIIKEKNIRIILLRNSDIKDQIKQIEDTLKIAFALNLKRCIECNNPLDIPDRDKIKDLVPPYIYQTHDTFLKCSSCGKIYWKGTHVDKMKDFFGN